MKGIKKQIFALVIFCGMLFGGVHAGYAQGPYGGYAPGPQLTPEQMATIQKIFNENYAEMDATRQALTQKRAQLDAELANPAPDKNKIETLSREIGELRGKMLSSRAQVRSQLAKEGLPANPYGPGGDYDWRDNSEVWQGQGWHHRAPRHHGSGGYGMRGGCPWW